MRGTRNHTLFTLGLGLWLVACCSRVVWADHLDSATKRLKAATTTAELDAVMQQIDHERQEMTFALRDLLRSAPPSGAVSQAVKAHACYLLGEFADLSVADVLIENIDVYFGRAMLSDIPLFFDFPCEEALEKLGVGVQDRVVTLVMKADSVCKRELGERVLSQLRGLDDAMAILRNALGRARGDDASRLREALGSLALGNAGPFPCRAKVGLLK